MMRGKVFLCCRLKSDLQRIKNESSTRRTGKVNSSGAGTQIYKYVRIQDGSATRRFFTVQSGWGPVYIVEGVVALRQVNSGVKRVSPKESLSHLCRLSQENLYRSSRGESPAAAGG